MKNAYKPRKAPVQARSAMTVSAILDASIHILLDGGMERFSTTRVAARAGASVGSLYQYFPNRESLLVSALDRHLTGVVEAIEQACRSVHGATLETIGHRLVDSFIDAKFADVNASRALYAVSAEVGGAELVRRMSRRSQRAVCDALATASDTRLSNLTMVTFVVCTALIGPVQAGLETAGDAEMESALRNNLKTLVQAYLRASAISDVRKPKTVATSATPSTVPSTKRADVPTAKARPGHR